MVLINSLTIDDINAALIHLQRSSGEVVGGVKEGDIYQNITIQNSGGGSGKSYDSVIKIIQETLASHETAITEDEKRLGVVEGDNATQTEQIQTIFELLSELSDNGIQSLQFDATSRYLILYTQDGNTYDVEIPSEEVTLSFDAATNKLTFVMGSQTQEVTLPYINTNQIGVAGGVASLDANGRVPYSQLPESAMTFMGEWDASTNTPTLADGVGTNGDFYVCSAGGTVNFGTVAEPREVTFVVNDRVIYEGGIDEWVRLPAGQVSSVNGMSGAVQLDATNVPYDNNMSIKQKIDSSTAVQSDWTETNSADPSFIKHKIPIWITSGSATDDKAQALFDLVHPVNEVYVQYPGMEDPNDLYNVAGVITCTWDLQTQYAGAFFRSSGGNAAAFQTTLGTAQADATAKKGLSISSTLSIGNASTGGTANVTASGGVDHTHNMQHKHTRGTMNITGKVQNPNGTFHVTGFEAASGNFIGAFVGSNFTGYSRTGQSSSHAGAKVMEFDASKTWEGVTSDSLTNTSTSSSPTAKNNTGSASDYSHSHPVYLRGGVSLGNGDTETRPTNYTIQIWKRTA